MKNPKINESLIIGVDFSKRDDGVLIVGRRKESDGYRNPQAARRVRSQTR